MVHEHVLRTISVFVLTGRVLPLFPAAYWPLRIGSKTKLFSRYMWFKTNITLCRYRYKYLRCFSSLFYCYYRSLLYVCTCAYHMYVYTCISQTKRYICTTTQHPHYSPPIVGRCLRCCLGVSLHSFFPPPQFVQCFFRHVKVLQQYARRSIDQWVHLMQLGVFVHFFRRMVYKHA